MDRVHRLTFPALALNPGRCQTSDLSQNPSLPNRRRRRHSPAHAAPPLMEMAGPVSSAPRTVEDIYKDYAGRRAGLVRALTSGNVEDTTAHSLPYSPSLPFSRAPLRRISRLTPFRFPLVGCCCLQMWTSSTACATQVNTGSDLSRSSALVALLPLFVWGFGGFDWFLGVRVEKENLCLYGLPNGGWEVSLPVEEVPPEMPEPALGINFARDGMKRRDWLSLVAVHSDAWVVSVAFFFAAKLNANERYCAPASGLRPPLD